MYMIPMKIIEIHMKTTVFIHFYISDRAMIIILLIVLAFQIKSMHTIGILSFLK